MGDQPSDTMNLDLNLDPVSERESSPIHSTDLNEWVDDPLGRLREAVRLRWRRVQVPNEGQNITVELNQLLANSGNDDALQTGEGSVAAQERGDEDSKLCENKNGLLEEEASEKKDEVEKSNTNDGSYFDCNICLDLAREPVVTCCGHLFCWPCLYPWLTVHSEAKECPVCKGEVTTKNVTPIYGCGSSPRLVVDDAALKFPSRPDAHRVESLRQAIQRNGFNSSVEDMLRRMSSRFDYARELIPDDPHPNREDVTELSERTNSLLNRILTSRGLRRERFPAQVQGGLVDLTHGETSTDTVRLQPSMLRRARSSRTLEFERLAESTFRVHPHDRNQELPTPVDDRDSFSSIAAVINSEDHTAIEIDSMVSISTSSSRMRNDPSRASDIDNGDYRALRRRRLD